MTYNMYDILICHKSLDNLFKLIYTGYRLPPHLTGGDSLINMFNQEHGCVER